MPLIELISNYGQEVAKFGHSIRLENLDSLEDTIKYAKELCNIDDELAKVNIRTNFLDIASSMIASCKEMDTVTLSDIVEYELLDKLENILIELGA
jgi:hypothetical protein